jgi:predicted MFS family arabinose efflux permease
MLPLLVVAAVVTVGSFVLLIGYERRVAEPVIPLDLFRQRSFAAAFGIAVLGFLAFSGLFFANTLYLQEVRGLSASMAGLLTVPLAIATFVAAPASGWIMARVGARPPLLIAGATMLVAALLLVPLTPTAAVPWLIVPYVVFGIGYGMLNAPVNTTAVSDLPDDQAGVAASLISTAKQIGSALGVAVVGSVLAARPSDAVTAAFDARSWIIWGIVAAAGAAVVVIVLPRGAALAVLARPKVGVS